MHRLNLVNLKVNEMVDSSMILPKTQQENYLKNPDLKLSEHGLRMMQDLIGKMKNG